MPRCFGLVGLSDTVSAISIFSVFGSLAMWMGSTLFEWQTSSAHSSPSLLLQEPYNGFVLLALGAQLLVFSVGVGQAHCELQLGQLLHLRLCGDGVVVGAVLLVTPVALHGAHLELCYVRLDSFVDVLSFDLDNFS